MASGMKFPLNKPNGLNGSPGLRAIGRLGLCCSELLRASWRRGVNFKPHCAARQQRDFISQGAKRPPKCEVCQIRARNLQVWAFWRIWCDDETVTYVLSMAVGGIDSVPGHHLHYILIQQVYSARHLVNGAGWGLSRG
jgi:hypothetical protein